MQHKSSKVLHSHLLERDKARDSDTVCGHTTYNAYNVRRTWYIMSCIHALWGEEVHVHVLMRDAKKEGRKKQARSNKQTRQSNTAHPRQSLFLTKMSWDSNPRHSTL